MPFCSKISAGILVGFTLNIQIYLETINILLILSWPINEHGILLNLFRSSLVSLQCFVVFSIEILLFHYIYSQIFDDFGSYYNL